MNRLCAALACLMLLAGAWTPASAQSLADAAKRAEEERAKAAAEKKAPAPVITNEDLKKKPTETADVPGNASGENKPKTGEAKPGAKKAAAEKADPKQGEAYWKRRATELHARLTADEKPAAAGRERVDSLQRDVAAIECIVCRERTQREAQLARMKQDQARLDAKVESDRAAIQAFEEEGRRAGILPGWLRP
jgi:hypothetical protein